MLFVNGGTNRVGIGAGSSPDTRLDIHDDTDNTIVSLRGEGTNGGGRTIQLGVGNTGFSTFGSHHPYIATTASDSAVGGMIIGARGGTNTQSGVQLWSGTAAADMKERFRVDRDGSVVANEQSYDQDFRVESDTNANVIFLDAGENRLGFFGTETSTSTNVHNGICTKTAIGCYSVGVSDISSGASSSNIDIPFSRLGDGVHEFAYHAHGNGGTTNFGIVAHFYVQENPDRHVRSDISSQQFSMSSTNSGSNIRIQLTNGGSFTAEGGKFVIRKMV